MSYGQRAYEAAQAERPVNPDCKAGKHHACNSDAWDGRFDCQSVCCCACHDFAEAL